MQMDLVMNSNRQFMIVSKRQLLMNSSKHLVMNSNSQLLMNLNQMRTVGDKFKLDNGQLVTFDFKIR